jgi:hypothetical protein
MKLLIMQFSPASCHLSSLLDENNCVPERNAQIKVRKIETTGEMGKTYTILFRIPDQKRPLAKLVHGGEVNIKMDLTEVGRCSK